MFNFFSELASDYGIELGGFNIVNISNSLVYVENHRGVIFMSSEKIELVTKKGQIIILGEGLKIKRITSSTLVVVGKIKSIEG